jgi:hypothetical protein
MFICKKSIINKYCKFIFTSLSDVVENFKPDLNQKTVRIYGYITECLFGAWIEYNNYKIYRGKIKFICR